MSKTCHAANETSLFDRCSGVKLFFTQEVLCVFCFSRNASFLESVGHCVFWKEGLEGGLLMGEDTIYSRYLCFSFNRIWDADWNRVQLFVKYYRKGLVCLAPVQYKVAAVMNEYLVSILGILLLSWRSLRDTYEYANILCMLFSVKTELFTKTLNSIQKETHLRD